ncbi:MAG TPA: DUF4097 family beta strand repeat-containing protein [Rectinemataceae bacterium]|nr:DUF4097 family beta strand repeat-containing protein [Rectinemataceae bacterium]
MSRAEIGIEPGYYTESLDPGQAERLVLRFPHADLLVMPGQESQISIELEIRGPSDRLGAWKPSIRRREGIMVVADEGIEGIMVSDARIRVPASIRDIEAHSSSGSLEIRDLPADILAATDAGSIRVAGGAQAELSSVSGEVEVEGSAGVAVRVGSGPIRCRDIGGPVNAESESGDVLVESAAGNVIVLSDSGDISIQRPGGRLRIATESGDVELELEGRFAGGEISTSTGDVSLVLGGADLELRAETLSGDLDVPGVDLPQTSGPRRCALRLGAGGRRLHVRSVSGDVEIES